MIEETLSDLIYSRARERTGPPKWETWEQAIRNVVDHLPRETAQRALEELTNGMFLTVYDVRIAERLAGKLGVPLVWRHFSLGKSEWHDGKGSD